ncbi:MAG: hypothetical protein NT003_01175 [Candidatus Magasanikbacteria bacterium]|nr:hypothetical protein [Candidatus Magasanikbacteria bacterium]
MGATFLVLTIYYGICSLALALLFAFWFVTRKKEDDIWRWILTLIASMIFCTIFWFSYWFGTIGMWGLLFVLLAAVLAWQWKFFSHSTQSNLDRSVFCAFGAIAFGMIMFGGYTAGERGWWGMAPIFYWLTISMMHHTFEPD